MCHALSIQEGITVTSDTLVWSLEKPLAGDISSPFRLRLSYPQSDANMAPDRYCAQAEVHRVKLCSKASELIMSATVGILVYVTALKSSLGKGKPETPHL